eukprot:gb/GEZN01006922.1/.p1 GENE.gb/GEZN01006922.1/~~gb/GEZN01006922.1/.p1  ORF type:complete len:408 (-),score=32.05 gb/GEZN01006922.1/:233-1456(-)
MAKTLSLEVTDGSQSIKLKPLKGERHSHRSGERTVLWYRNKLQWLALLLFLFLLFLLQYMSPRATPVYTQKEATFLSNKNSSFLLSVPPYASELGVDVMTELGISREGRVTFSPDSQPFLGGMKVVVINLAHRKDRLNHTVDLLSRLGVRPVDWVVVRPSPAHTACQWLKDMGFENIPITPGKCSELSTYIRIWLNMSSSGASEESRTDEKPVQFSSRFFMIVQDDLMESVPVFKVADTLTQALKYAPMFHALYLQPCADWCFLQQQYDSWKMMYQPLCLGATVFRRDTTKDLVEMLKQIRPNQASAVDSMLAGHVDIVKVGTTFPLFHQEMRLGTDLPHRSWASRKINQSLPQYPCSERSWKAALVTLLFCIVCVSVVFTCHFGKLRSAPCLQRNHAVLKPVAAHD